jgi:1-phosphofructokinase family hexose kinase
MTNAPKLLCVSLNPAIDRRITVAQFRVGEVNRASSVDPAAGGKAAHVAFAATALGAEVRWLAFLGAPDGEACRAGIEARGVIPVVVPIAARTRTNLEIIDESSGKITEVLEPGPVIHEEELVDFARHFTVELRSAPTVILSGSLPKNVPDLFYAKLVKTAKDAGCRVFLDASGEPLTQALSASPDVIKPNREESGAILKRKIGTVEDAVAAAQELRARGPKTVILSLGAEGAVVVDADHALLGIPPPIDAISTVGSGDSFLAGWAVGAAFGGPSVAETLRLAIACGTANCRAESPGVLSRKLVKDLQGRVKIVDLARQNS